jgi:hypothetical protein
VVGLALALEKIVMRRYLDVHVHEKLFDIG